MTHQVLEDQKAAVRGKETELIDRENKLIQKEKECADWEGKIKLADNEVREQKILNQKEQSLDQIRKDKLRIKEGQIENELTRLKGINLKWPPNSNSMARLQIITSPLLQEAMGHHQLWK